MEHGQDPLIDNWQTCHYPSMRSRILLEASRTEEERYDSLPPVSTSHSVRSEVPPFYHSSVTPNSDDRSFDTNDGFSSDSDQFLPSIQDTLVSATDHLGFSHSPLWQNRESVSADSYLYSQYGPYSLRRSFFGTPLSSPVSPYGADMPFPRSRPKPSYYSPCTEDYRSTPPFSDMTPQAPSDDYDDIPRFHSLSTTRLPINNRFPEESFPYDTHGSSDPFWNPPASTSKATNAYHSSSLTNHLNADPTDWPQTKKEETKGSDLRRGSLRRRGEGKLGVKETLESIVQMKKVGKVEDARRQMELLLKEAPTSIPVYVELVRLMMDSGDFQTAREYLKKALALRGDDEQLLERSLRVEEKMGNLQGILQVAEALTTSRRYRNVKLVVDACLTMAKLGAVEASRSIFEFLIEHEYCRQGNLVLSYVLFVHRSISVKTAYELLRSVTQSYSKHGPLWFFFFSTLEHRVMVSWDRCSMLQRVQPQELLDAYTDALRSLSIELRWKVFYLATQMLLRTITHLRLAAFGDVLARFLFHTDASRRILPARLRKGSSRRVFLSPVRALALSAESPVESVASGRARQRTRRPPPSFASRNSLAETSPTVLRSQRTMRAESQRSLSLLRNRSSPGLRGRLVDGAARHRFQHATGPSGVEAVAGAHPAAGSLSRPLSLTAAQRRHAGGARAQSSRGGESSRRRSSVGVAHPARSQVTERERSQQ